MSVFIDFGDSDATGSGLGGFGFRAGVLGVVANLSVSFVLIWKYIPLIICRQMTT